IELSAGEPLPLLQFSHVFFEALFYLRSAAI
ncbi:unnamed protein product, partial [marine sediment metagenome]